jgi:hypothetical protein
MIFEVDDDVIIFLFLVNLEINELLEDNVNCDSDLLISDLKYSLAFSGKFILKKSLKLMLLGARTNKIHKKNYFYEFRFSRFFV